MLTHHQYASDHILQSYELYIPPSPSSPSSPSPSPSPATEQGAQNGNKIWLIHIHGGAWRDPTVTAIDSFTPTLSQLVDPAAPSSSASVPRQSCVEPVTNQISGYASVNYRLSPHPSYPQCRSTTAKSVVRDAQHPDHIRDILTGLRQLQSLHGFRGNYVLVGHSCGATLAWQVVMPRTWDVQGEFDDVHLPVAIVGVCGIYDLPLLVERHEDVSAYREFTVGAFGPDERVWADVSPARWKGYAQSWAAGGRAERVEDAVVAVLAHSRNDGLVDWDQVERMESALLDARAEGQGGQADDDDEEEEEEEEEQEQEQEQEGRAAGGTGVRLERRRKAQAHVQVQVGMVELEGPHDEIWRQGDEMTRAINVALDMLQQASRQKASKSKFGEGDDDGRRTKGKKQIQHEENHPTNIQTTTTPEFPDS